MLGGRQHSQEQEPRNEGEDRGGVCPVATRGRGGKPGGKIGVTGRRLGHLNSLKEQKMAGEKAQPSKSNGHNGRGRERNRTSQR